MSDYSIKLKLFFDSAEDANMVLTALNPSLEKDFEKRAKTEMKVNKNVLLLNINAVDLIALRASINHYLKLIIVVNDLIEHSKKHSKKSLGGNKSESARTSTTSS